MGRPFLVVGWGRSLHRTGKGQPAPIQHLRKPSKGCFVGADPVLAASGLPDASLVKARCKADLPMQMGSDVRVHQQGVAGCLSLAGSRLHSFN